MSNRSLHMLVGAAALALAASSLAGPAGAAGRNLANGGFPAPAHGTAMFLNLAGGAHFQLGFSEFTGTFYFPANAAAVALAPYGLSLAGTPLPNPNGTSTSAPPAGIQTPAGGNQAPPGLPIIPTPILTPVPVGP